MKYLRYLIISVVALFLIPRGVSATQTVDYKDFKVGDEITVWLDAAKTRSAKFRIIKDSASGRDTRQPDGQITPNEKAAYQWVTAIYEGTVGESIYGVASDADLSYEHSTLRPNVVVATKDWKTPKDIRLLTLNDLYSIVGSSDSATVTTALKKRYPWLLLDKMYWLGDDAFRGTVYMADGTSKEANVARVMTPVGLIFELEENDTQYIRPVITIHKGFVEGGMICTCEDCDPKVCPNKPSISIQACLDEGKSEEVCIEELCKDKPEPKVCPNKPSISIQACLDSGKSEEVCIEELCKDKPTPKVCPNDPKINIQDCIDSGKSEETCIKEKCTPEKPDNPKTGTYISIGILICGVVAGFVYFLINKRKYFTKI